MTEDLSGLEIDLNLDQELDERVQKPRKYLVIIYDDDFTPLGFVYEILMKMFHCDEHQAERIAEEAQQKGSAVVAKYPKDIAETKVEQAKGVAQQQEHPLYLEARPEESE